jgi:hypothetical protein
VSTVWPAQVLGDGAVADVREGAAVCRIEHDSMHGSCDRNTPGELQGWGWATVACDIGMGLAAACGIVDMANWCTVMTATISHRT